MVSTWTTSIDLSDLAASRLQQSGVTAFSFLPNNDSGGYRSASAQTGGKESERNTTEIHFDEFDKFFNEEDDFNTDFPSLDDSINFADSSQVPVEVKASSFGCVICGDCDVGTKEIVAILSDQRAFDYESQRLLHETPSTTKTHKPKVLFPKPKPVKINKFDFSTPSPDDTIIAKQKAAL